MAPLIPDADRRLAEVRAIPDVAERVRAVNALIAEAGEFQTAAGAITRDAVRAMHDAGDSLAKIAAALGVSRGRAQALVNGRWKKSRSRVV